MELEKSCVGACEVLKQGMDQNQDNLSQRALETLDKLTTLVEQIMCASGGMLIKFPTQDCGRGQQKHCQEREGEHNLSSSSPEKT